MKLSPMRKAFVNAYLGEANGNATKAAIMAGYSENGARQQASQLLTCTDIQEALGRRIAKAQMSADESLIEVSEMARAAVDPKSIRAQDKLKANELLLKVYGKLQDKRDDGSSRVTVNIGFLSANGQPEPTTLTLNGQPVAMLTQGTTSMSQVMTHPGGVSIAQDGEP